MKTHLDVQGVPRRYFFELLSFFTPSEMEKEKLLEFASAEGQVNNLSKYSLKRLYKIYCGYSKYTRQSYTRDPEGNMKYNGYYPGYQSHMNWNAEIEDRSGGKSMSLLHSSTLLRFPA